MTNHNYFLSAMGITCALGNNANSVQRNLFTGELSGMTKSDQFSPGFSTPIGQVTAKLAALETLPLEYRSRNNLLLLHVLAQIEVAFEQLLTRYGKQRIGIVLGTSTSGIAESEAAVTHYHHHSKLPAHYHYHQQEIASPSLFLQQHLKLTGPALTISTACSSSAKAFSSARRLLQLDLCEAVLVGGVDTLCELTINGFSALEAVSKNPCIPFSKNRNGINIGEGAALFILSRDEAEITLSGVGESSDAYHISAPEPNGQGAQRAMQKALQDATLSPEQIDYLNLHGTATIHNDLMEGKAVSKIFPADLPCSATKPLTGHTLGAAGAIETALCWLTLQGSSGALPPHRWDGEWDETIPKLQLVKHPQKLSNIRHVMSNSFAFGGNNASVILSHA